MANLGSDDTPIAGESFGLPSGWAIVENADGEIVIEDSGENVVFRRDETAGEWVTDSIDAESVDVEELNLETIRDSETSFNSGETKDLITLGDGFEEEAIITSATPANDPGNDHGYKVDEVRRRDSDGVFFMSVSETEDSGGGTARLRAWILGAK